METHKFFVVANFSLGPTHHLQRGQGCQDLPSNKRRSAAPLKHNE